MKEGESSRSSGSEMAAKFFSRVSREYPSAKCPQGARLVELCREEGVTPQDLYQALMQGNTLDNYYETIKHVHLHYPNPNAPEEITPLAFRTAIDGAFETADMMVDLPPTTLTTIQNLYDHQVRPFLRTPVKLEREQGYNFEVGEIIRFTKSQLAKKK